MTDNQGHDMDGLKTRQLIAWCENDDCGEPIYEGDRHIEEVSEGSNRYFYHLKCSRRDITPDGKGDHNG